MKLKQEVTLEEVEEAHELFTISTMKAMEGNSFGYAPDALYSDVNQIEDNIRKRVCIGSQVNMQRLVDELSDKFSSVKIGIAVSNMVKNREFKEIKGRRLFR